MADQRPRHRIRIGSRRTIPWAVALTVTLATFMEVLDSSIANVSLPHIAGSLGATYDEAVWVLTSYLVSAAIVLPVSGWLSTVFGRKRFYMTCVVLFTVSLVPVRHRAQSAVPDRRANSARRGRRRLAALRTGHPGRHVLRRKARHGFRGLRHGGGGGARHRPHAGRLDHRQLQLALDLLHQPAGRACSRCSSPAAWWKIRPGSRKGSSAGIRIDYIGLGLIVIGVACFQFVLDKGQEDGLVRLAV